MVSEYIYASPGLNEFRQKEDGTQFAGYRIVGGIIYANFHVAW